VAANKDSVLLKVSRAGMATMLAEAPALAAPFLDELGRAVVGRGRNQTKNYEDSIRWSRAAGAAP